MNNIRYMLTIGASVCGVASIPSAALADGPYVGVSGGVVLPEDSRNTGQIDAAIPATADFDAIAADTPVEWRTEFDAGFAINGQVGYAFDNGLRLELEAAYSQYDADTHSGLTVGGTDIDAVDSAILTRGAADAANPTVGAVIADGQGQVENFGVFGNVFYDIQTGSAFKPYVGAGLGFQSVDVEYAPSDVLITDESDESLAYQLMAGASFELSERTELFGQYTYRATTEDADVELDLLPATLGVESEQSIISAGVRVKFGG